MMQDNAKSISGDLADLRQGRSPFVGQFVGAMIDSQKAWTHTSLISRVSAEKAGQLDDLFSRFDANEISDYFVEMASGTWTQQVAMQGLDAPRLEALSKIIIRQLVMNSCVRGATSPGVGCLARLEVLIRTTLDWIEGQKIEGDLPKISQLIGDHPELRVMLVAAYAPGLAISLVILRANSVKYPFVSMAKTTGV